MNRLTLAEWLASSANDDDPESSDNELFNPENQKGLRAALASRRISHKYVDLIFYDQQDDALDEQEVRIESANTASTIQSDTGKAPYRIVVVYGIRDHPVLPDTVVEQGYWFYYDDDQYTVVDVILTHGEVQALCRTPG